MSGTNQPHVHRAGAAGSAEAFWLEGRTVEARARSSRCRRGARARRIGTIGLLGAWLRRLGWPHRLDERGGGRCRTAPGAATVRHAAAATRGPARTAATTPRSRCSTPGDEVSTPGALRRARRARTRSPPRRLARRDCARAAPVDPAGPRRHARASAGADPRERQVLELICAATDQRRDRPGAGDLGQDRRPPRVGRARQARGRGPGSGVRLGEAAGAALGPLTAARRFPASTAGHPPGVQTRHIGNDTVGRVEVGAIGLGLMTFDQTGTQPREQLLDTVRAALDAGVTLFDTADAYGPGDELGADAQGANETAHRRTPRRAGRPRPRPPGHQGRARPHRRRRLGPRQHARAPAPARSTPACQRLGVEQIALWQHHRPDPTVAYAEVIGDAERDPRRAARCAMLGLSNADPDQIRLAHEVLGDAPGQRAEPVLPGVPQQPAGDRRLRGAGPGLPALEPARRAGGRQGAGRQAPGVRRDRRGPRRQRPAGRAGLGARPVAVVIPIPGPSGRSRSPTPPRPPTWT